MTVSFAGRVYRPTLLSDVPLAFGFVLLVCCAISGAWLFEQQRKADAWVRHTFKVENQLSQVQIEGLTAAVDIRTSILGGRDGRDIDIRAVRKSYFAHVDDLRRLARDNPSQLVRIASLREISDRRFDMLEEAMADKREGRISDAAHLIAAPDVQVTIARARRIMDDIRDDEVRLLKERSSRAARLERLASIALIASMLLAVLLALFVFPERRSRIRSLWVTKQALEAAVESKRIFLANMSHEIRTPMNGVLGFTELLLANDLTPDQRSRAELIDSSGRAMMRLLNDILDFSKIEAGQMRMASEPFDLRHALDACVRLVSPAAAHKGLSITSELDRAVPRTVVGDGLRLRQIVLNLLGNAVKFTEEGSITLRAFYDQGNGGNLILEIQDTGIGIDTDRHQAIFEEFVQADSAIAPRFGGTGLGLAITLQLVSLMNGTIGLDSEPGVGSIFRVEIPMKIGADSSVGQQSLALESEVPSHSLRILLAEDHDVNQQLFMGMLAQLGCRADLAENGAEAIRMINEAELAGNPYSLVLMDVQMPVMDGLEAMRRIRAGGVDGDQLPIVALTANAYESDVAACFAAGSQMHLSKPVHLDELARALRKWSKVDLSLEKKVVTRPSIRDRYEQRKYETLTALDELVRRGHFSNDEVANVADLLHKLAGTAAMFGEAELGTEARELEVGMTTWTKDERETKIRAGVDALKSAA